MEVECLGCMATHISKSPEETAALGELLGQEARAGLLVGLSGDLGVGKTQFVKGIARGLGIPGRVHSPTFGLVNAYQGGRMPCYHLDLYRLETAEQIRGAGLDEYLLQRDGVTVIEWVERLGSLQPREILMIHFRELSENEREIVYESAGA
jgi:tRNA threonylcarbamoyladenosine biosynthesis protein TsaE